MNIFNGIVLKTFEQKIVRRNLAEKGCTDIGHLYDMCILALSEQSHKAKLKLCRNLFQRIFCSRS